MQSDLGQELFGRMEHTGVLVDKTVKVTKERMVGAQEVKLEVARFSCGECVEERSAAPGSIQGRKFNYVPTLCVSTTNK